jgi:3-oxoacyl-[acyl-carrier-protein] synthase-3
LLATWISGELGIYQTRLVRHHRHLSRPPSRTACPRATRVLHEVQRPVLVVRAERFSDKIWTVSPSRMIFDDGAAAIVVGRAPPVARHATIEHLPT